MIDDDKNPPKDRPTIDVPKYDPDVVKVDRTLDFPIPVKE